MATWLGAEIEGCAHPGSLAGIREIKNEYEDSDIHPLTLEMKRSLLVPNSSHSISGRPIFCNASGNCGEGALNRKLKKGTIWLQRAHTDPKHKAGRFLSRAWRLDVLILLLFPQELLTGSMHPDLKGTSSWVVGGDPFGLREKQAQIQFQGFESHHPLLSIFSQ